MEQKERFEMRTTGDCSDALVGQSFGGMQETTPLANQRR